jgi:hypothetical protein
MSFAEKPRLKDRTARVAMVTIVTLGSAGVALETTACSSSHIIPVTAFADYPGSYPGPITVGPANEYDVSDTHHTDQSGRYELLILQGSSAEVIAYLPIKKESQVTKELGGNKQIYLQGSLEEDRNLGSDVFYVDSLETAA